MNTDAIIKVKTHERSADRVNGLIRGLGDGLRDRCPWIVVEPMEALNSAPLERAVVDLFFGSIKVLRSSLFVPFDI